MATKELKDLVAFGLSCGELIAGLSDGIGFDDVGKVVSAARLAGPGMAGAPAAIKEYTDMTDADAVELENYVVQEFDIPNDSVETAIEGALKVIIELHVLVKLLLPKT